MLGFLHYNVGAGSVVYANEHLTLDDDDSDHLTVAVLSDDTVIIDDTDHAIMIDDTELSLDVDDSNDKLDTVTICQ
mgnify:CR=1 FL=1